MENFIFCAVSGTHVIPSAYQPPHDYIDTVQKMKFPIKDFFCKCDQIRRKLPIWLHLLKKSLMENFIFCAVSKIEIVSFPSVHQVDFPLFHSNL